MLLLELKGLIICLKLCICLKYLAESRLLYLEVSQCKLKTLFLGEHYTHVGSYIPESSNKSNYLLSIEHVQLQQTTLKI